MQVLSKKERKKKKQKKQKQEIKGEGKHDYIPGQCYKGRNTK